MDHRKLHTSTLTQSKLSCLAHASRASDILISGTHSRQRGSQNGPPHPFYFNLYQSLSNLEYYAHVKIQRKTIPSYMLIADQLF
jgi:hypothetical protein